MGKIFSPPKMPSAAVIPAMPAPVPVVAAPVAVPTDPPAANDADQEVTADEQRLQNILTRRRGRVGTVGTSFSGVLNDTTAPPARKTLLGE